MNEEGQGNDEYSIWIAILRSFPGIVFKFSVFCMSVSAQLNTDADAEQREGSELVIGLVTPVGTNTTAVAEALRGALSQCQYRSHIIKVTDFFNRQQPGGVGENEDERVRRLISAGDEWCKQHDDAGAVMGIAVNEIRSIRARYHASLGNPDGDGLQVPRTTYIVHSIKRSKEVTRLREIYGPQFLLLGCQAPYEQRIDHLLKRSLSAPTDKARRELALELMRLDASEDDPMGQTVSELFPQSDYFLRSDESPQRFVNLVFGDPTIAASMGEVAMSLAVTTSLQSLSTSRRVGASLVKDDSIIAVGCNEVPRDEAPDIHTGKDASEQFKFDLLRDTLQLLYSGNFLDNHKLQLTNDGQIAEEVVSKPPCS